MIDGGYCKKTNVYHGHVLALTTKTASSNMLVLAFAWISKGESSDNWGWFLDCCRLALPRLEEEGFAVLSDGNPGLLHAVRSTPNLVQRRCVRHLIGNLRLTRAHHTALWNLARASTEEEYDAILASLGDVKQGMEDFINCSPEHDPSKWALAHLPDSVECMYRELTTNVAEGFMSKVKRLRFISPAAMMREMAEYVRDVIRRLQASVLDDTRNSALA